MNLTETAANVDVDSAGMVEQQTKGITMCAIPFSNFSMWN